MYAHFARHWTPGISVVTVTSRPETFARNDRRFFWETFETPNESWTSESAASARWTLPLRRAPASFTDIKGTLSRWNWRLLVSFEASPAELSRESETELDGNKKKKEEEGKRGEWKAIPLLCPAISEFCCVRVHRARLDVKSQGNTHTQARASRFFSRGKFSNVAAELKWYEKEKKKKSYAIVIVTKLRGTNFVKLPRTMEKQYNF